MKNLFKILVFSLIILPFTSCVDEDDFDFDSLAQTTITPSINAPLINLEVQLNDFLDLEQLSDTANGFEIIQVNEANDSYLEFVFSMKDTFDISSFIQQIEGKDDVQVNLSDISIPDLSDLGLSSTDLPEFYFSFPDQSVAAEDLSIEVEEFENSLTNEIVYSMKLNCNDIYMDVTINKKDLEGEPAIGRRFKGSVWMQGTVCLENMHL